MTKHYDIVFESGPGPDCRFQDIEDDSGRSAYVAQWLIREDGSWAIRVNAGAFDLNTKPRHDHFPTFPSASI